MVENSVNVSDNDISKEFLKVLENVAQSTVNQESKVFLKQTPAKVIGFNESDNTVYVYFADDENQTEYSFKNHTGKTLNVGETVFVQYTKNRANGIIVSKSGNSGSSCLFKRGDGDNSIVAINEASENTATGDSSYCGGRGNSSGGAMSFIGGGMGNSSAVATAPVICGGSSNIIEGGSYAPTICGGNGNKITGKYAEFIGGGSDNKIINTMCGTICGGISNTLNGINNAYAFIGGGTGNKIDNAPFGAIIGDTGNTIENTKSHNMICGGEENTISGTNTSCSIIAHGYNNKINGGIRSGIFTGYNNVINNGADCSAILSGYGCLCDSNTQAVMGKYNISSNDEYTYDSYLVVGNGGSDSSRSNAFRVDAAGNIYAGASINSTGADFAEMREWSDGNPNNEDRRGLFVKYDDSIDYAVGEYAKIRIANANDDMDDIIGIVSSNPTVVCNTASEVWQGMYQKDIFGNILTHEVIVPAVVDEIENPEIASIKSVSGSVFFSLLIE